LLTDAERRELEKFAMVEMEILGMVGRIDDVVACLRDFAPINDPYVGNRTRPPQEDGDEGVEEEEDDD
jgi:hypothetical protein